MDTSIHILPSKKRVKGGPIEDMVKIELKPSKEARFKLYLRIPSWCENYEV